MKRNNFIFTLIDYRELWIYRKIIKFIFVYTVHLPTDAHLVKLRSQFTLKVCSSYRFRSTTFIMELANKPG